MHINPDGRDLSGKEVEIPLVHVFPQQGNHSEAILVGNIEGLKLLKDALEKAIADGESAAVVFATDGEGYNLCVKREDAKWDTDGWRRLAMSYTDEEWGGRKDPLDLVPVLGKEGVIYVRRNNMDVRYNNLTEVPKEDQWIHYAGKAGSD